MKEFHGPSSHLSGIKRRSFSDISLLPYSIRSTCGILRTAAESRVNCWARVTAKEYPRIHYYGTVMLMTLCLSHRLFPSLFHVYHCFGSPTYAVLKDIQAIYFSFISYLVNPVNNPPVGDSITDNEPVLVNSPEGVQGPCGASSPSMRRPYTSIPRIVS